MFLFIYFFLVKNNSGPILLVLAKYWPINLIYCSKAIFHSDTCNINIKYCPHCLILQQHCKELFRHFIENIFNVKQFFLKYYYFKNMFNVKSICML